MAKKHLPSTIKDIITQMRFAPTKASVLNILLGGINNVLILVAVLFLL